jgi:cytochrome bd ubiquinol oxidase subunit II
MTIEVLPLLWMVILVLAITLYVLLDGFSLGIGILFPLARRHEDRGLMMASVAPVWDGNQTWLVGGGAALFAAFPQAFNLLLSAFYLPLTAMLIALVFRGCAFEFRFKADDTLPWSIAFAAGSFVAAFCQGLVLGTYVQGFAFDGTRLVAGHWHFLSPFSLMTAVSVVIAYALLGACWLVYKTEGELRAWARQVARRLLPLVLAGIALVSLWTPYLVPQIRELWFDWPNFLLMSPIPLWLGALFVVLARLLRNGDDWPDLLPFLTCIALYLVTLMGLAVSLWPYVVPRVLTFSQAAAPASSLMFVLVGVLLIVPIVLVYTAHAYYVFRGKVRPEDAYH